MFLVLTWDSSAAPIFDIRGIGIRGIGIIIHKAELAQLNNENSCKTEGQILLLV